MAQQISYNRDEQGFLINTDDTQYQQILLKRQQTKERAEIIGRLVRIESELTYIKDCLQTLIARK